MDLPHEKPALGSLDRTALLALIEPVLHAQGAALVEVSFKAERPGWVLRVAIEREGSTHPGGGVTVDLCADVSRALSLVFDESEFIAHAYQLEVASPGVERTLRSTEELQRFVGQPVKVMLREPAPDGQRVLRGTLLSVGEDTFVVRVDGNEITCPVENVKQANLQLEFGTAHKH
jgi:ribosome maturation factor RimP